MITHIVVKIIIIIPFTNVEVILKKNMGTVPKKRPIVVSPKASPGVSFNIDTNNPRVIDIVILNNRTPIRDTSIKLLPINKNGNASSILLIATFFIPNESDNIPPKALPTPIVQNNKIVWMVVLFHDVGKPYPIYPRTITIITARKIIILEFIFLLW